MEWKDYECYPNVSISSSMASLDRGAPQHQTYEKKKKSNIVEVVQALTERLNWFGKAIKFQFTCQPQWADMATQHCVEKDSMASFGLKGKQCYDDLAMNAMGTKVRECWYVCQIFGIARLIALAIFFKPMCWYLNPWNAVWDLSQREPDGFSDNCKSLYESSAIRFDSSL